MTSHQGTMTSRRGLLVQSPSGVSEDRQAKERISWHKCCSLLCNSMLLLVAFLTGGVSLWALAEADKLPAREGVLLAMGGAFRVCLIAPAVECITVTIGVFVGLYGVHYRKRDVILLHFSLILVSAVAALIFAIITAYSLITPESVDRNIEQNIDARYGVYGNDYVTRSIDILQIELTCCGSGSYESWADSDWLTLQKLARFQGEHAPSLPLSCCQLHSNSTRSSIFPIDLRACQGFDGPVPNQFMHREGCSSIVMEYVLPILLILISAQVGLFVMEILVTVNSVVILHHIRADDPALTKESEYIARLYNSLYQKHGGNVSLNIQQKGVTERIRVDTPVAFANLVYIDMDDLEPGSPQSSEVTSRM